MGELARGSAKPQAALRAVCGTVFCYAFERDAEGFVAGGELVAVDRAELVLQGTRGGEAVGDCVGIGPGIDFNGLYCCDADWPDARDVTLLAGAHVAELPQANGLRLVPARMAGRNFFLKRSMEAGARSYWSLK